MNKAKIYDFLRDLTANNSKEWMHEHKKEYLAAKDIWLDEIALILKSLSKYKPAFEQLEPKKTIMRINTNRRFHPNKPIYKDNFAFSPENDMLVPSFYIHISPSESFLGGGLHKPSNDILKKIRSAIDYDGKRFKAIINEKKFQDFYGGLSDDPDKLKTSPRGYTEEHEHIDLLRRKNFTALKRFTLKEFISDNFVDIVEEAYKIIQPMNEYLEQAVSFDGND